MNLSAREKIIFAVVAAIASVAIYTISQLTSSNGSGGTTLGDVIKELIDDVGFLALCILLILALVFLPVGL